MNDNDELELLLEWFTGMKRIFPQYTYHYLFRENRNVCTFCTYLHDETRMSNTITLFSIQTENYLFFKESIFRKLKLEPISIHL